jgi:tetratricopeptide (TPR) repeat protein
MASEDKYPSSSVNNLTEKDGLYWLKKGEIYWVNSDKNEKAAENTLKYFDKAIELEPLNYLAWANKGLILKIIGRVEDALACYDRAIDIQPLYVNAWYNKGVLLGNIGRYKTAKTCFKQVLMLDPENTMAIRDMKVLRGIIKKKQKKTDPTI